MNSPILEFNSSFKPNEFRSEKFSTAYGHAVDTKTEIPWVENLRRELDQRGWSVPELAARMGQRNNQALIDRLYKYLQGRVENPRGDTVGRIARALDMPVSRLRGEPTDTHASSAVADDQQDDRQDAVRVVGYVGAGAAAHFYAVAQGDLDEVPAPPGATENTVAVEVRGESLGPLFDRWLVFYDQVRSPVTSDLIGRLCVVGLLDDRVLVKKIRRARNGLYDLISNTDEDTIRGVEIQWAARVKHMVPR